MLTGKAVVVIKHFSRRRSRVEAATVAVEFEDVASYHTQIAALVALGQHS